MTPVLPILQFCRQKSADFARQNHSKPMTTKYEIFKVGVILTGLVSSKDARFSEPMKNISILKCRHVVREMCCTLEGCCQGEVGDEDFYMGLGPNWSRNFFHHFQQVDLAIDPCAGSVTFFIT